MERGRGSEDGLGPLVDLAVWLLTGLALSASAAALAGAEHLALGLGFALVSLALTLSTSIYTGADRVVTGGWISLVLRPLLALVFLAVLIFLDLLRAFDLFAAQVLAALLALAAAITLARHLIRPTLRLITIPGIRWQPAHLRYLRIGVVLAASQTLISMSTQVDILVLTAFRAPEEVGYYHAAARAALVISMFAGMTAAVAAPTLMSQVSQGDKTAITGTVRNIAFVGFSITFAAFATVLLIGQYYLRLYGPGFESVYPVMILLCGAFVVFSLAGPAQMVLRAHRLDRVTLWALAAAVTINALLSILLVGSFGMWGVALATAAQFVVMGVAMNMSCRYWLGLRVGLFTAVLSVLSIRRQN